MQIRADALRFVGYLKILKVVFCEYFTFFQSTSVYFTLLRLISVYFVRLSLIYLYLYCYGVRREHPFHLKVFCVFIVFSKQQKEVVAKRLPLFI